MEELRQPICHALESRLGKKEASKLVDFEETDWVSDQKYWVVTDKDGERRAFVDTLDKATLKALGAWFLMQYRFSELDSESPSPDTWEDTYWKDYRICCKQDIANFERRMTDFYAHGFEPSAMVYRKYRQVGHEKAHGTQAEKQRRWAAMQKECDKFHLQRPELSWARIRDIVAQRHQRQDGWSSKSIQRHCRNPLRK